MGGLEVSEGGAASRPTPAKELIEAIGMKEPNGRGGRIAPRRRAISDARAVLSVVDGHPVPAEVWQHGEAFHEEVSKGANVRPRRIHPIRVLFTGRGLNAAAEG